MSMIRQCSDYIELIKARQKRGFGRVGYECGVPDVDETIWFRKQILVVVTGYSSTGKSEFVDHLCMCWAMLHDHKTLFFSPENNPPESHWVKHVERYGGKQLHKLSSKDIEDAAKFIDKYFAAIELAENESASIDLLLEIASKEYEKNKFDYLVLDPWNECDFALADREDLYISKKLSQIKKFLKPRDVTCIVVAHPRTPRDKIKDLKGVAVPAMGAASPVEL